MTRFATLGTTTVSLGACECPGTPHEADEADVYDVLGWDDLVDLDEAPSEGARWRLVITRAIASWNLVESVPGADGLTRPVPIHEARVRLLGGASVQVLMPAATAALERAKAALPNVSAAPSRRSRRGSGS